VQYKLSGTAKARFWMALTMHLWRLFLGWLLLLGPVLLGLLWPIPKVGVEGIVVSRSGPVAGAHVRWQGDPRFAVTNDRGRFRLPPENDANRRVAASKPGYLIASARPGAGALRLTLIPLPAADNEDYVWIDPHPTAPAGNHCGSCHGAIYREWAGSAHARSARNPKFLHLFAGTAGSGPPFPTWNVRAEYALGAGVCATCHAPTMTSSDLDYDVRKANGVAANGVHCDYCHKIVDAPTDRLGTRFGRDGLRLLRPAGKAQLSFGPLDDAIRAGESFGQLPLYRDSRYCASCHEGVIFGVHVYGTFSEWLDSPARRQGRQCQDCHMAPTGTLTNLAPGHGGIARDPYTLASHRFPGGDLEMLRSCLEVKGRASRTSREVRVDVTVRADHVGHRVPTGFVDRHLILVVEACDAGGLPVAPIEGPRLPPSAGDWRGRAGWLYAKQLADQSGRAPVPFWGPVAKVTDTRLFPHQVDRRRFVFGDAAVRVKVHLWYRRFWQEVADQRGWRDNDLLVHTQDIVIGAGR
jgi:mono/diheme cytochrome c family protein